MVNYVKRFVYVDSTETRKVNPLFYPFLVSTFLYGLGFATLNWWSGVSSSSLFQAFFAIHPWLPIIWGVAAVLAATAALVLLLRRKGRFGELAAMFGFLVWLFALIIYAMNGFWLVMATVAAPNLYFWIYYYFKVKWYERQKDLGLLLDPQ